MFPQPTFDLPVGVTVPQPLPQGADVHVREPLHLTPVLIDKPWGGRRLAELGHDLDPDAQVGESWEVADLSGVDTSRSTRVRIGPHAGRALTDLIHLDRAGLLGAAISRDGHFPLLVKLLDASEPLSVQVHPTPEFAAGHANVAVKTESWVVLDAEPGAHLYLGVGAGVEPDQLRAAAAKPAIIELLRSVPARAGDVHHVPAGTVHALGAGIVVAEVQTPGDTTFRLYDWEQELGREGRELHVDAALACARGAWECNTGRATPGQADDPDVLVDAGPYVLRRHHVSAAGVEFSPSRRLPRVLQVVSGHVDGDGFLEPLRRGSTVLLPAAWSGRVWATTDEIEPAVVLETQIRGGGFGARRT